MSRTVRLIENSGRLLGPAPSPLQEVRQRVDDYLNATGGATLDRRRDLMIRQFELAVAPALTGERLTVKWEPTFGTRYGGMGPWDPRINKYVISAAPEQPGRDKLAVLTTLLHEGFHIALGHVPKTRLPHRQALAAEQNPDDAEGAVLRERQAIIEQLTPAQHAALLADERRCEAEVEAAVLRALAELGIAEPAPAPAPSVGAFRPTPPQPAPSGLRQSQNHYLVGPTSY